MSAEAIAMHVYNILCDHYETEDKWFEAESMRWVQLIERCGLTMDRAQGIASEVCGQNETLSPWEFFPAFEAAAYLATKITKEREKTGPRKCGYCRDTGFATIYHRRNPELTECVGCQCSQGQKVLAADLEAVMKADPKNPHPRATFASAVEDPSLFDPIRLYHRHQTDNARAWAKRNGLEGKDESEFAEKYREITHSVREEKMLNGIGRSVVDLPKKDVELESKKLSAVKPRRDFDPQAVAKAQAALASRKPRKPSPPPQLNPEALALAVYDNGDQRNEWE